MKNSIYYFLLVATFFTACKKNDGPVSDAISLDRVDAQPQITKDGGSQAIDVLQLSKFSANFKVGLYTADAPAKMDIVIRKNNKNVFVKVFKAGITTYPESYNITATQLATLFGTPVELNDTYDISVDMYSASGKKYEAYPIIPGSANASVFGFGSGVAGQPGSSLSIQYKAICAYDPGIYEGNFVVEEDKWADFVPGDIVKLTKIDDTHISMIFPAALNPVPVVITINPGDNSATVAKQSSGSGWNYGAPGYPGSFVLTAGSSSASFVSPCDKTVELSLDYGYNAGTFGSGPYKLTLKKQ